MDLTPIQHRAVHTIDRSLGIIAGAGAGKTRVLVERCVHLLRHAGLDLHQLLAITFTERAAQELRTRLADALPAAQRHHLHGSAVTTFHGLALRLLQAHAPLIGLSPLARLLDDPECSHLCATVVARTLQQRLEQRDPALRSLLALYSFRRIAQWIESLLHDRWNVAEWWEHRAARDAAHELPAPQPHETALLEAARQLMIVCTDAFRQAKRERQVLDFHDLEECVVQLLNEHPAILADYQQQFRHIIVDEFQDTNRIQLTLIQQLFTPPDNVLCIVGDPKQSIYRFRGAQVDCFQTMLLQIVEQGGEVITLNENFRSRPRIIDFVHQVCPEIPSDQHMVATRTAHETPCVIPLRIPESPHRRRTEAELVAQQIHAMVHTSTYRYGDIACLFPTHLAIGVYAEVFRAHGIPVHIYGSRGLLERRPILDLLYAIEVVAALARDQPDDPTLFGLVRSPLFGLSDDACYRAVHLATPSGLDTLPVFHRAMAAMPAVWDPLMRWQAALSYCTTPELLRLIIHDTQYLEVLLQIDPTGAQSTGVEQFLVLAEELASSPNDTLETFLARIHHMQARDARLHEAPLMPAGDNAVQCMTIHATKGNEFPIVVLADLAREQPHRMTACYFRAEFGMAIRDLVSEREPNRKAAQSPRWERCKILDHEAEVAETNRLLYVAMTRAADHLILPIYAPLVDQAEKARPSWTNRMLTALAAHGIPLTPPSAPALSPLVSPPSESTPPPQPRAARLAQPMPSSPSQLTVSELETYHRCPQEYYLKYVLQVPATQFTWPDPHTLPPQIRGEIIHEALQQSARNTVAVADAAAQALQARGWDPAFAQAEPMARLLAAGATLLRIPHEARLVEFPFHLRLPNTTTCISGTIDCLNQSSGQWDIIDYKTDRVEPNTGLRELANHYSLQMTTYALALWHAGFQPLHATSLYFLDANAEVITDPITPERLHAGEAHITALIDRIRRNEFDLPPTTPPPCARCAYHHNQTCSQDRLR